MKRYPLLQSQMGVFAECIKNPDSAGYNLPYTCRLPDDTDMQRLKGAWERLIARRMKTGVSEEASIRFVDYSDMPNVRLCLEKTMPADLRLRLDGQGDYWREQ